MATTGAPLPDPMGGTSSTYLSLVVDIVPVRIINTNALDVRVMNFPGVPPPLPGLGGKGAQPPPLPTGTKPIGPGGATMNDLGLGSIAKLGTVAGLAAAGIGLVKQGFEALKATFIDPILHAAKGGFDKGVTRGTGASVLETAAEGLGIVFGLLLMPITFRLAASFLAAARAADEWTEFAERWNPGLGMMKGGPGGMLNKTGDLLDRGGSLLGLPKGTISGGLSSTLGLDFLGLRKPLAKTAQGEDKAMKDIFNLFMRQQGTAPSVVGIADVRQQAQLAAMTDPLEAEFKKMMIEGAKKVMENAGYLKQTADNTAPVLGGKA